MIWRGWAQSRWRLFRNALLGHRGRRGSRARPGTLVGALLALSLAGIIYAGMSAAFSALVEAGAGPRECGVLLGILLGAAAVGMLVFDLHEVVATVVADSDLQLLRTAPIAPAHVFAIKVIDALPRTSVLLATIAVPALVAYARAHPLAPWAWAAMGPALLALWLIPFGFGSALTLVILRVVPGRFVREAMRLVTTFFVLGLWLVNSFALPRVADRSEDIVGWLAGAAVDAPPAYRVSPGSWVASLAVAGALDTPSATLAPASRLVVTAAVALALAALVAAANLDIVQARMAGVGIRRGATARHRRRRMTGGGFLGAVIARDGRMLRRDWAVFADVLITTGLWTLLPIVAAPLHEIAKPLLLRAMLFSLAVGLGYEVGARALPFERRGLAWARLAPVPTLQWTMARWLSVLALALPMAVVAALVSGRALGLPVAESLGAFGQSLPALVMAISIGLWTGARFGNPDWTHQRAMLSGTGRLFAVVLIFAQGTGWIMWIWVDAPGGLVVPALGALVSLLALAAAAQTLGHRSVT